MRQHFQKNTSITSLTFSNSIRTIEPFAFNSAGGIISISFGEGLREIHDYAFDANVKDGKPGYGRGYRCSRGPGQKGVKLFTESDNAGSFGGQWLHIEISQEMAKDPAKLEQIFRSLKPGQ